MYLDIVNTKRFVSKKIFQINILNLKFKFPSNNSKQQIQSSSSG